LLIKSPVADNIHSGINLFFQLTSNVDKHISISLFIVLSPELTVAGLARNDALLLPA
jgi:hypothetical protein